MFSFGSAAKAKDAKKPKKMSKEAREKMILQITAQLQVCHPGQGHRLVGHIAMGRRLRRASKKKSCAGR